MILLNDAVAGAVHLAALDGLDCRDNPTWCDASFGFLLLGDSRTSGTAASSAGNYYLLPLYLQSICELDR